MLTYSTPESSPFTSPVRRSPFFITTMSVLSRASRFPATSVNATQKIKAREFIARPF